MSSWSLVGSDTWPWVAAVMALWLVWSLFLEYRGHRRRPFRLWRALCLLAAAGSLVLCVARPARLEMSPGVGAVLLTPRADEVDIEGWPAEAGAFAVASAEDEDLGELIRRFPGVSDWSIAGVGLPWWELERLPGRVRFPAPVAPETGIDRIAWRRRIALGELLTISGSVSGAGDGHSLHLSGPGGDEAVSAIDSETAMFELTALPKQEGRWLYRLTVMVDGEAIAVETLEVEVVARSPPALLWLAGAPGFESRAVKNWLSDVGGEVLLRTRVSRARHRYEYLNRPRLELGSLSPADLEVFDLVVVDGAGWDELSKADRAAVRQAVRDGMGVLFVPPLDGLFTTEPLLAEFVRRSIPDLDALEVRLSGPGLKPLAPLRVAAAELDAEDRLRPVARDEAGRLMAAMRPQGLGAVALTLVEGTHRWLLRGEADAHGQYWSHLLATAARQDPEAVAWGLPLGPVLVDRPIDLELVSQAPWLVTVTAPGNLTTSLPMEQGVVESRHWRGRFHPRREGWHEVTAGDQTASFYVQGRASWRSWQQREAAAATRKRAFRDAAPAAGGEASRPVWAPIARGWFFALLVLSLALLWADDQWRSLSRSRG